MQSYNQDVSVSNQILSIFKKSEKKQRPQTATIFTGRGLNERSRRESYAAELRAERAEAPQVIK